MPKQRKCRVRGCGATHLSPDLRFYSFPKDVELHRKWRDNLGIAWEAHLAPNNSFVCARHFAEGAMAKKYLKRDAVPTLHLGQIYDEHCRTCMENLPEVPDGSTISQQQWQFIFCKIEDCGDLNIAELLSNTIPQIEVHRNDELPKKICSKCLEKLVNLHRFQQICIQSDQRMRKVVFKRNLDSKFIIPEDTTEFLNKVKQGYSEITALERVNPELRQNVEPVQPDVVGIKNELSVQEYLPETTEERIEFECVKTLTEVAHSSAADPLQSNEKIMEHATTSEIDVSTSLKNDDPPEDNVADSVDEPLPTITVDQLNLGRTYLQCSLCNASFNERRNFDKHLKFHQVSDGKDLSSVQRKVKRKILPYKCEICNIYFEKHDYLRYHTWSHEGNDVTYDCNMCDRKYLTAKSLGTHKRRRHQQQILQKHACELCDKIYNSPILLKKHVWRMHTCEGFLCSECGKSFKTEPKLKLHSYYHGEKKTYECPKCPRIFNSASKLHAHKNVHLGKRYKCDICGFAFNSRNGLKAHKRHHSGERPYKCDYCEKRFVRADSKVVHMRTHTGEKPFQCQYCDRAFATGGDRMQHLKRAHLGENIHRCELCPLKFRMASEMRLHFATHKNDDEETRKRNKKALMEEEAKLVKQSPLES